MIFEFRNKESKRTHYIMGTMHVQDSRAFCFNEVALDRMKECNLYIGEIDLGRVDPHSFQDAFIIPTENKLDNVLSAKRLDKYSKILLKCFDINLHNFLHLSPLFIQSLISQKIFNNDKPVSLDAFLYHEAVRLNMKTDGLESLEEQYNIAQKLDFKSQLKSLETICRKPDNFRKEIDSMILNYTDGDIIALYKKGKKSLGINRKVLLYERNKTMAERIINYCKDNICFITVGAGHLAGDKGILSELKKNGYKVKTIYFQVGLGLQP